MKTVAILVMLVCQAYGRPLGRTRSARRKFDDIWKDNKTGKHVFRLPNNLRVTGGASRIVNRETENSPKEDDAEALSSLQSFVVEALFHKNPSLRLTKSELELLFLEETGLEMSSASMLDKMFQRIDVDGSGCVCAKDLVAYLQQLEPTYTNRQRALAVTQTVTRDVSWLMTLAFISGTSVSISTNLLGRSGRSLPLGTTMTPFRLSAWLFTIGTLGFTVQTYQRESHRFELNESAKRVLFQWIQRTPWKQQPRNSFFAKFGKNRASINRVEFQKILESFSVFLPKETHDTLYSEIDPNNAGLVTKSDIEAFVEASQRKTVSKFTKFLALVAKCIRCWEFWSNFTWLIGSILFVTASYMPASSQGDLYTHLLQAGSIFYLLGGVTLLLVMYDEQFMYLSAIEELQRAIQALVVPRIESSRGSIQTAFRKLATKGDHPRDSGDGMLDSIGLYNALQDAGVLIPLNLYMEVFRQANKSGDGQLCLEEFTDFLMSVDTNISNNKLHPSRSVRKKMSTNLAFWLSWLFVFAGALFTLESYGASLGISETTRSNMLLVASSCYAINSSKKVVSTPIVAWREHIVLERNNLKFKNDILASAMEYSSGMRKKGRANRIQYSEVRSY